MRLSHALKIGVRIHVVLAAALCLFAQDPATPNPAAASKDARTKETAQGLPPRVSPSEYQTQTKAGTVTIAAEFVGHAVPTIEGALTNEDYVAVELGLYGPPDARLVISLDDFSLRINGKKVALKCQPFGVVFAGLKDPEYIPPETVAAQKSKTSLGGSAGGGGGQGNSNDPPPVVHIPIAVQRGWQQRTQKASLPLGDRPLPQAGVIFFQYRGKVQSIESLELIYSGAAGKTTLNLKP